jgi:hypothetical protein
MMIGVPLPARSVKAVQADFSAKALAERDGDARLTWRRVLGGRLAFEFLVGWDPAHAPRRTNRWGDLVEELAGVRVDILAVVSDASQQTVEEAKGKTATQALESLLAPIPGSAPVVRQVEVAPFVAHRGRP